MMLEALIETQESHGFETKKLCVCAGHVGHGDRQSPKAVIEKEKMKSFLMKALMSDRPRNLS